MQQLELKESFGAEAIETACAFANAHEGFIVIGVDDPGLVSRPRNRLIAQTFYDMHIIEHYGSGMRRMKNGYEQNVWNDYRARRRNGRGRICGAAGEYFMAVQVVDRSRAAREVSGTAGRAGDDEPPDIQQRR